MNAYTLLMSFLDDEKSNKTAVISGHQKITYQDLYFRCLTLIAAYLGDVDKPVIFLHIKNASDYLVACIAADVAGVKTGHLHINMTTEEMQKIASGFKPDIIVTSEEQIQKDETIRSLVKKVLYFPEIDFKRKGEPIKEPPDVVSGMNPEPEEPETILFTSGSTGTPKGVVLPRSNPIHNAEVVSRLLDLQSTDIGALFGPMTMGMNLAYVLSHLLSGATIYLEDSFISPNNTLNNFREHQITGFSTVPSAVDILVKRCDLSVLQQLQLRYIRIGAGRFQTDKMRNLVEILPHVRIYKTYGLSEIGIVSALKNDDPESVFDSVGRKVEDVSIEIIGKKGERIDAFAEGEIVVWSPYCMKSYNNNPEDTANTLINGKVHTGDLGYLDEAGYLFITDRIKDIIKIAGESIHPGEIESVITRIDGVSDAAVVGIDDSHTGEAAIAFVELDANAEISLKEIIRTCRKNLPIRLVPKTVHILEKLPRVDTGKVEKRKLIQMIKN